MRTLLIVYLIFGIVYAQNIEDGFPKSFPANDFGYNLAEITEGDPADSLLRMELRGSMLIPDFLTGFRKESLRFSSLLFWGKESPHRPDHDSVCLGISGPFEGLLNFPEEFRYRFKGLSIKRVGIFDLEPLYVDSTLECPSTDTIILKFSIPDIMKDGEDGTFQVGFDSLWRVDSKNRSIPVPSDYQRQFYFELNFNQDPISEGYGYPKLFLMVNDEPYHEGDYIPKGAMVYASLKPSPTFIKDHPEEVNYLFRGVKIIEPGYKGIHLERYKSPNSPEWSPYPQFQIPIDSLEPVLGLRTGYFLEIGEVFRQSKDGIRYRQNLNRDDKIISFRISETE